MKSLVRIGFLLLLFAAFIPMSTTIVFADTETLRPNGVGSDTDWTGQTPAAGNHWDKVDDTGTGDDVATFIYTTTNVLKNDLFAIEDTSGAGTINSVTVYFKISTSIMGQAARVEARIKSGVTISIGTEQVETLTNWTLFSESWANDPNTSAPWTWAAVDALEAGVRGRNTAANARCTQVYVIVDFSPVSIPSVTTDAASLVEETTATLNGDITATGGADADIRGFDWGTSVAYGQEWLGNGTFGTGAFSTGITSLNPGTLYHFRAKTHNSEGWGYGSDRTFTTKPLVPTNLSIFGATQNSLDFSWTKGTGATKTMLRYQEGSLPPTVSDGTQGYYDTGTSTTVESLTADTQYFVRIWSWVEGSDIWSDAAASGNATTSPITAPSITAKAATNVGTVSAQLNSTLDDSGGEPCDVRFGYGNVSQAGFTYVTTTAYVSGYTTGQNPLLAIAGLDSGTTYYFRAQARNANSTATSGELSFTTLGNTPVPLTFLAVPDNLTTNVSLHWTWGNNSAPEVLIRYRTDVYPANVTGGTAVFSGAGNSYVHIGLASGITPKYSIWGKDGVVYSDSYISALATTSATAAGTDDVNAPAAPAGWLQSPDPTALENFEPFYTLTNGLIDSWNMPRATGWIIAALMFSLFVGIVIFVGSRGSFMAAALAMCVTMVMFTIMGLIPGWMGFTTVIATVSVMVLQGQEAT